MTKKHTLITHIASLMRYDIAYDCPLPRFLAQIEEIVAQIPVDQRSNVFVDWMDGTECDSGYIDFEYRREETDAEAAAREQDSSRRQPSKRKRNSPY